MAVLPEYKGLGIGGLLLKEGESIITKDAENRFLWFNARVHAVDFYIKHDYETFGQKFDVPNVCEHIVMFKHFKRKNI